MFTGIVEETGSLQSVAGGARGFQLTVSARRVLEDIKIGDSIAVNGVCLTAASYSSRGFTADVMPETLNRSSLGALPLRSPVNLERAMKADGRFGGHMVSGHIDGTGTITHISRDGNALWYTIRAAPSILRFVIEKGSVAVDGVSLTAARVTEKDFSVSLIPHTAGRTALGSRHPGDRVNLENDCVGKYIEKFLRFPSRTDHGEAQAGRAETGITPDLLKQYGF